MLQPRTLISLLALLATLLAWSGCLALDITPEERNWLQAHADTIRVGVLPDYPPIEFFQDGQHLGLTADYLRHIESRLGIRFVKVVAPDWETLLRMALTHQVDVIGSIQQTAERRSALTFTRPYIHLPNAIINRKNDPDNLDETDLQDKKVALVRGYANSQYLKARYPHIKELAVNSDLQALQSVVFGFADAAVVDLAVASHHIEELGLSNLKVAGFIDYRWDLCFGIRSDWPLLAGLFDRVLAEIPMDVQQTWRHRWIGLQGPESFSDREKRIAAIVTGLMVLLLGGVVLWNRQLKSEVQRATTRLRKALDEAHNSNTQLRELTDSLPQTIFEISADGTISYVNRYAIEWSGYSDGQLLGQRIQDFLVEEDRPLLEERIRMLLGQQPEQTTERVYRVRRADGSIRHVLGYARPIRQDKEIPSLRGILVDISDRLSYELFIDQLFEAIPDPVFVKDRQHRWIHVNKAFCDLLGYARDELIGQSDFDFFPEHEAQQFWTIDDQVFSSGQASLNIEQITPADGATRILATHKSLLRSLEGEPLLVGIIRDITEQHQATTRLAESERRFRQIFDATNDALFLHDAATGAILDVNKTAETMYGASREELLASDIEALSSGTPPFTQNQARLKIAHALKTGLNVFEWLARRFDGKLFWVEVSLRPATIDNRRVIITAVRDISRRKQLEEQMLQTEKMLTVGHLAAGIAHEINNPLAGVLQNLQLVQMQLRPDHPGNRSAATQTGLDLAALSEYLHRRRTDQLLTQALDSARRARFIVEDLLTFSRRPDEEMQPVDLEKLIDRTLTLVETEFDPGGSYDFRAIRVDTHFEQPVPRVPAWRDQLQQALINLLRNAAQAMFEARTHAPWIRIELGPGQGSAVIRVQDNGPGMDDSVRSRIFEPFFTTRPGRGGTGIGLALVSYIITQNHGGSITVDSQPGQGTTFTIRLPEWTSEGS